MIVVFEGTRGLTGAPARHRPEPGRGLPVHDRGLRRSRGILSVLPHAIGLNLGWVFLGFGWCLVYIILEPIDAAIATVAFIAGGSSCKALLAARPWPRPRGHRQLGQGIRRRKPFPSCSALWCSPSPSPRRSPRRSSSASQSAPAERRRHRHWWHLGRLHGSDGARGHCHFAHEQRGQLLRLVPPLRHEFSLGALVRHRPEPGLTRYGRGDWLSVAPPLEQQRDDHASVWHHPPRVLPRRAPELRLQVHC
jgi:hypothetical protein